MLSFITPSIRVAKLPRLYRSIQQSYSGDWEMIVIGPYDPFMSQSNVRWVEDWGNLTRATQIGLIAAKGEIITRATDDGVYLPGALDKAFTLYDSKTIVSLILTEGDNWVAETLDPASYRAYRHDDLKDLPFVPKDTLLCNYVLVDRQAMLSVGGWDCQFEQLSMADVDLSIRLRKQGLKEAITDFQVVKLEWLPGTTGDHAPVHNAHFEHDLPLFKKMYSSENRGEVKLDNWKNAEAVWQRRFGK